MTQMFIANVRTPKGYTFLVKGTCPSCGLRSNYLYSHLIECLGKPEWCAHPDSPVRYCSVSAKGSFRSCVGCRYFLPSGLEFHQDVSPGELEALYAFTYPNLMRLEDALLEAE